jgi:7-cyano-7-deazaguanine synthase
MGRPGVSGVEPVVCLLSGGIDSATAAAIAKAEGAEIHALTVNYGQRHVKELESAGRIAAALGVAEHKIVAVDLSAWGGSALTSGDIPVPCREEIGEDIPVTYVPARNLVLLSLAASYAEAVGAEKIYFGANSLDYSGYPDCRPEFVQAFQRAVALGTKCGVEGQVIEIVAPLQYLTKAEILRKGLELGVDYALTWSCYQGEARACGQCDSCKIRLAAFAALGQADPIAYAE